MSAVSPKPGIMYENRPMASGHNENISRLKQRSSTIEKFYSKPNAGVAYCDNVGVNIPTINERSRCNQFGFSLRNPVRFGKCRGSWA